MPLSSMTGYGRAVKRSGRWRIAVEITSVNRRQLDVQVQLPRFLAALDPLIQKRVQARLARGSVTVSVTAEAAESGGNSARVDADLAGAFVVHLRQIARRLNLPDDLSASLLTALPDVIQHAGFPEDPRRLWPAVRQTLDAAIAELARMRAAEGRALARDLARRVGTLSRLLERLRRLAPCVLRRYRRLLAARLRAAGVEASGPASDALARELALFADRSNVEEELARLESHLAQTGRWLRSSRPAGRTLDFLCQEMLREINTVGAKAGDAAMSSLVVRFKTELECLREQVQNVE